MADGDRLIEIVESGRGARGVQRSSATRVRRRDVVQAVTHGEPAARTELVIDLGQKIRRVDRIRVDAGSNERPLITSRRKTGVDGRDTRRRNGDQSGLIEPALLDVREIERAVLRN